MRRGAIQAVLLLVNEQGAALVVWALMGLGILALAAWKIADLVG